MRSGPPLALGLAVGLIPLVLGLIPGDDPARLGRLIAGYGLAVIPFIGVLVTWRGLPTGRRGLMWLLAATILARLPLLILPPLLSEDVWRYVWDGAMHWAGVSPYTYAPADAALDWVVSARPDLGPVRAAIGHSHIPTIYPPAAQIAFAATAGPWPSPISVRLLMALADGVTVLAVWRWLARLGRDPRRASWVAFAPVMVLEGAVGGHVDALGAMGLALTGAYLTTGPGRAALGLAIGVGTKILPVVLVPWLLLRRRWGVALGALALVAAISAPYLLVDDQLIKGLTAYGHRWRGNDGAFAAMMAPLQGWLEGLVSPGEPLVLPVPLVKVARALVGGHHDGPPAHIWPDELAFAGVKLLVVVILGLLCLERLWRARSLNAFAAPVLTAIMLLSPVVHPWYLLWITPLAVVGIGSGGRWPWAVILWGGLIWLAYLPRITYISTGGWRVPAWLPWVEYLPVWITLAAVGLFGLRRAGPDPRPVS